MSVYNIFLQFIFSLKAWTNEQKARRRGEKDKKKDKHAHNTPKHTTEKKNESESKYIEQIVVIVIYVEYFGEYKKKVRKKIILNTDKYFIFSMCVIHYAVYRLKSLSIPTVMRNSTKISHQFII